MAKEKTFDDYTACVDDWYRKMKPFLRRVYYPHKVFRFSFINLQYEELFIPQMREEVCIFIEDHYGGITRYTALVGQGRQERWEVGTRDVIESWFAKHYPGVSPWNG